MSKKLKVGDKVIVKDIAVGTTMTYGCYTNSFTLGMGDNIGIEMTIDKVSDYDKNLFLLGLNCGDSPHYHYHKSWLKKVKVKKARKADLSNKKRIKAVEGRVDSLEGCNSVCDSDNGETKHKWNPKGGEWYVRGDGGLIECGSTEQCRNFGSEFNNEKDAIKASKAFRKYHRLWALALELNEGWEPDWNDYNQKKYYIYYTHDHNSFEVTSRSVIEVFGIIYFRTGELAKKAISILEQENE